MITRESIKLHDIAGNTIAKRALEVALVQEHSIRFIGISTDTAKEFAKWTEEYGLKAQATTKCPCGNLGHSLKDCKCSEARIRRHKEKELAENYDLEVEVKDEADKVYKMVVGEHKEESERKMLHRIQHAGVAAKNIGEEMDTSTKALLKQAISQRAFTLYQSKTLLAITRSIAALAKSTKIQADHLKEALRYTYKINHYL